MPKGYLIRCSSCGYLYQCETELMECLNHKVCEHCGSSDIEVIQQDEGRFGCTSRLNTHVTNTASQVDHPQPVPTSPPRQ
ncbi:hydrogenase maturation nickel metallochaperone HypA [Sporomusa termitida]|uniref:Uncharacterized protein n=1 Tax=Sporomusa termitida TaxID=2377 RepID=A0A517DX01_9FIRM|nr:hydrogenase maturation nickel metallochaperone HypA [Sporomusa termitida]QDR81885.1 hypothetical protein SPTER_33040 [Sporomusa termitida]